MHRKAVRRVVVLAAISAGFLIGYSSIRLAAQQPAAGVNDQLPPDALLSMKPITLDSVGAAGGSGVLGRRSSGNVLGVDSLKNWSSYFYEPGFDPAIGTRFSWPYTMVGKSPFGHGDDDHHGDDDDHGGTTTIDAPIVPVTLDLRNFDGSPRFVGGQPLISSPAAFINPVLNSPIFSKAFFDSSHKLTQYTDAVQRAEFFHLADDDWHTMLRPIVKPGRTMVLIRGTYQFSLNADGTCCRFILIDFNTFVNALFPPNASDTSTVMGAAENAHDIHTTDLSTFLFPNAYLFEGSPANCCVLGFHSYDVEPGGADNGWRERRYVMDYSSWISPGLFGGGFADVTALSHELSETFNDPFVNNTTPIWLSPNGNCQNDLEVGDVVEGLPNGVFPMTLNGFTYHPQNEALLQWFAGVSPSNAIHGAYSYPDISVLTTPSVPLLPDCMTPFALAKAPKK